MAQLLKGKAVADRLTAETVKKTDELKKKGIFPTLAIIRLGANAGDVYYEKAALKRAEETGIEVKQLIFEENMSREALIDEIKAINKDDGIHGVLIFRPLPSHIDDKAVCEALSFEKDMDGITPGSMAGVFTDSGEGYPPCTAEACMEILDYYDIPVKSARVALVGWGAVVGKPLSVLLLNRFATLSVCHIYTKDVSTPCKNAEIIISAAGKANLVGEKHLAPGQIVIDVGINADPNDSSKIVGDVDFAYAEDLVKAITPVPGGVGSVTTSVLAKHVIQAAEKAGA